MTGEPLTDAQQKWLHILSGVFSCLSFVASITVMQIVRNSKRKKGKLSTYDRLLFGISACDILNSIVTATDGYLEPRDNDYNMVWAIGNDATCNLSGFFAVFYITTWLYHAAISLYYVLLVRFGFRDESIGWKCELSFHLVAILWPAANGTAVLALGGFGPSLTSYGCFVSDWPNDCVKSTPEHPLEEGEVECNQQLVGLTTAVPTYAAFSTILLCNFLIYCHVRSTILKTTRNSVLRFDKNTTSDPSSPSLSWKMSRRQNESAVISTGQLERIRAVRNQSLLYFLATAATFIPVGVQKYLSQNIPSLSRETESSIYGIIVLRAIFASISGFFNLIIFCRPTYLRYRRNFPEDSRFVAFRRTIEAGTGRTAGGGTRRRERSSGKLQQNGWWTRLLKRVVVGRSKNVADATPVAVPPTTIVAQDKKGISENRQRGENMKSSDATKVDIENDKNLSNTTPHVPNQGGGDIQLCTDEGWPSGKPKTNRDADYCARNDAFPSNTSINFVMHDESLDQKFSCDEDEEVAPTTTTTTTSVCGLPTPLFGDSSSHDERSMQSHASQRDEERHRPVGNNRRSRAIEFDSSCCIEAMSTASTVEA